MHEQRFKQELILAIIHNGPAWLFATIALMR